MKVPISWLNKYLEPAVTARQAADAMERAGIEVEEVTLTKALDNNIVIGRVLEVSPHPNADKLRLAQVDIGHTKLGIVCGAPNLEPNQVVAVAQVGAVLPDGTVMKKATIRGQESAGMICSQAELELGSDHAGILVITAEAKLGQPVVELYPAESIVDITTAANRWDLTSIVGVAREVAAHRSSKMVISEPKPAQAIGKGEGVLATVANKADAPRYMVARLAVEVGAVTPGWMQQALQAAGTRPISVVVDITNYVMLEQGQPLHAFDAKMINGAISVRAANSNEIITTLDGKQHTLTPEDMVIADDKAPLALAGVMGGKNSEVGAATKEIILESASFHPGKVRKTAARYNLRTEASARFERGIPVEATAAGMARAIELLQEHAGGQLLVGVTDVVNRPPAQTFVATTVERIQSLLGVSLKADQIGRDLARLGLDMRPADRPEDVVVTVPWWRPDITTGEDIAEEVIKLVGYDALPATLPPWQPTKINFDNAWSQLWQAKAVLRSVGLFEVVTYSFISDQQITELGWDPRQYLELENPLSSEQKYLRAELLPSLLAVAVKNRRYSQQFGVFEFSKVFHRQKKGDLPAEPMVLGVLFVVGQGGYHTVKQVLDRLSREFNVELAVIPKAFDPTISHPAESAAIEIDGAHIGSIFRVHPGLSSRLKIRGEIGYLELNWQKFLAGATIKRYVETSKYPSIRRDVSVVVDADVPWSQLAAALPLKHTLTTVDFMGDYYGDALPEGKKVVTIKLEFAAMDRTLTDAEADKGVAEALAGLHKATGAAVR